jgi:SAM-dependent MidA family methyltransferase
LSLREVIAAEIRRGGPIPFSRYMELCLYHPELGYYSRAREQFGKGGDFYTSSDVHAVFGRLLARQFEEMWRALGSPSRINLIELGPGRGLFACDVLDWTAKQFPEFAAALRYGLVEQSAELRARLRERLAEHLANGRAEVFDSFERAVEAAGECLIVFGNEFFDALPVDVIDYRGAVRVGESDGRFVEEFVAPSAEELKFIERCSVRPGEGERVEVCLAALEWMQRITAALEGRRGFAVFIDYGYTREQQLAGRHRDTLMTYRRHTAQASPYDAPGEQDITAHVNWTALQAAATERGLESLGLVTQSQFLIGVGEATQFADVFRDTSHPQEQAKVALQLKHLVSPEAMGEVFQVLVLSHGLERDQTVRLSGLSFARQGGA